MMCIVKLRSVFDVFVSFSYVRMTLVYIQKEAFYSLFLGHFDLWLKL